MSRSSAQAEELLFKRLYISLQDLNCAADFAAYILKKGWHFNPWEKRGSIYLQQSAFTSSLITFYARPFTKSCGLPPFPTTLVKYNKAEKRLHQKILLLRHQVYAHSDSGRYRVEPFRIGRYVTAILGALFFKLTAPETRQLQKMINKNVAAIERELDPLMSKIEAGHLMPVPAGTLIYNRRN